MCIAKHPVGVPILLAMPWQTLGRRLLGRPVSLQGRAYGPPSPSSAS